jgi:hypothetical protein
MPTNEPGAASWSRQLIGTFAGAAIGWGLVSIFPGLAQRFNALTITLWCAALGAALTNLDGFARAGAVLTRSDNRWLNLLVGLGLPALVLFLIGTLLL